MLQQGVLFETAEGPLIFRGTITVFCADNLGSHALGGFKELLLPGIGVVVQRAFVLYVALKSSCY